MVVVRPEIAYLNSAADGENSETKTGKRKGEGEEG